MQLGPEQVDDASLLSIALGGREDRAREIAEALLARMGGIGAVVRAPAAELAAVPGMGAARGAALAAACELVRRATRGWPAGSWTVRAPADVAERLLPEMGRLEREELRVLLLNTKNVVQSMRTVYVGNLAGSSVRVGELYRDAVRCLAAGLVVVHNHPSGDPTPSADDLRITAELADAGRLLDIALLDHLVIGAGRWVSLRAAGAL
jgi:DNA repair protein RadC